MVGRRWRWLLLPLLIAAAIAAGGIVFLLGTTAGAHWLLRALQTAAPVTVEAEQLTGRLATDFGVHGLAVQWPGGSVKVDSLVWHGRALSLLRGRLDLKELTVAGLTVAITAEETPDRPEPPKWPTAPRILALLDARVSDLRLSDIEVKQGEKEPVVVERAAGRLSWEDGKLSLTDASLASPAADVAATLSLGLREPALVAQAEIRLRHAIKNIDAVIIQCDLDSPVKSEAKHADSGAAPESGEGRATVFSLSTPRGERAGVRGVTGPVAVALLTAGHPVWEAEGELRWARDRLDLAPVTIRQTETQAVARGQANINLASRIREAELTVAGLDLHPVIGRATNLSGKVEVHGTPEEYSGRLALVNEAESWERLEVAGPFTGDLDSISFPELAGVWLEGKFGGGVDVGWQPRVTVTADLTGRGLNPAAIDSGWPGDINVELAAEIRQPPDGAPDFSLTGRLLESTLRDHNLTGRIALARQASTWQLGELELHGAGYDLSAGGTLHERIDFAAQVESLTAIAPAASGAGAAHGWLRLAEGGIAGEVAVQGSDIAAGELRLAALEGKAELAGTDKPLGARVIVEGLSFRQLNLARAEAEAAGSPAGHHLRLLVNWPEIGRASCRERV